MVDLQVSPLMVLGIVIIVAIGGGAMIDFDGDNLSFYEELNSSSEPFNKDTDNDGLDDGKELRIGTEPNNRDSDEDGLTDGEELRRSTNPNIQDTDNDGLNDGKEVNRYLTDPTDSDTDGDGLDDSEEIFTFETDPKAKDTDEDGLTDLTEVNGETSPVNSDTDEDGLNDGEEINEYNTDPNEKDTDEDGLYDGEEVNEYESDPKAKDTDEDGLKDGKEVNEYGTDPIKKDTDNDNLQDYEEIKTHDTNPTVKDTDNDNLTDGAEIKLGTDPKDSDTDGDGFSDGAEASSVRYIGEQGDPLSKDIFLQVDSLNSADPLTEREVSAFIKAYESSPVSNPDGSTGIDIHMYSRSNSLSGNSSQSIETYVNNYYNNDSIFQLQNSGFYHALIVNDIESTNETGTTSSGRIGVTAKSIDGMLVESRNDYSTGSILMHEMGHNLGLYPDIYNGIDSSRKSWEEYPSVMNYNSPTYCDTFASIEFNCDVNTDVYGYSDGEGHNDWKYIETVLPSKQATHSELDDSIPTITYEDVSEDS